MNSVISNLSCETPVSYPKLMLQKNRRLVFLWAKGEGVVVDKGDGSYEVGTYFKDWDESFYKDFTGSICLSND